mmetsp:Transcript_15337/g.34844  ORF Transcript_15337/g.34844 Transcript_15337/m.34844 type:complete len:127 (+) Transcript_15337:342-722(+)
MALMTNVCQYFYHHLPKKPGCWPRWAPFAMMSSSTVLLLIPPLKNLVVNVCMASFKQNGFDSTIERTLDFAYLPIFGTRHMQVYTTLGYALMLWGTALQMDFTAKMWASFGALYAAPGGKTTRDSQ